MSHPPKILLATTRRWFSAARLALALDRAGFEVDAICPSGHPLRLISVLHAVYQLRGLTPLRSLRECMSESVPDLVIPCDDLAATYLRSLHKSAAQSDSLESRACLDLIERSLGDPSAYPFLESRAKFVSKLVAEGVSAPTTSAIEGIEALRTWCAVYGFPAVLKADGTWSGEGVCVVTNLREALHALRRLRSPVGAITVIKQALLEGDSSLLRPWLRRTQRTVSVQAFVRGVESNIVVACSKGEVLASISAEVLHTWSKHGPSSILRILPSGEMLQVATRAAKTFGLSGLFGLDFIQDAETGKSLLIEINPRATQTSHLPLGPTHDLARALFTSLTGRQAIAVNAVSSHTHPQQEIALFPLAWQGASSHPAFQSAYHDVPWEEPALVRAGEQEIRLSAYTKWGKLWMRLNPFGSRATDTPLGRSE